MVPGLIHFQPSKMKHLIFKGIMFAVFMPVHASWWQARTSTFFTFVLLLLWLNQIIGLSAYVTRRGLLSGTGISSRFIKYYGVFQSISYTMI